MRARRDVFIVAGTSPTWRQSLMVQALDGSVISHRSAGALHGLDGCVEGILEVTRRRSQPTAQADSVDSRNAIVHRTSRMLRSMVTTVDGIRCTNVATTLAELGAVTEQARVEQALDSALRLGYSTDWIRQTLEQLHRPGSPGPGVLLRLLNDPARSGALPDSWFERSLARKLESCGLPRPVLQHEVCSRRIDIAYPEALLAIEAHSRRFHFGRSAIESDQDREMELEAIGWQLLYVTWDMANNPSALARQIANIYHQRLASNVPKWSA